MKKIISLLPFAVLFALPVSAQISTNLTLVQPAATLSEWQNTTITYIVDIPPVMAMQVVIKAELRSADGTLVATKDLSKAQVFTLAGGTRIFHTAEVMPLDIMLFDGSYKSTFERTGQLPAGTYKLDVQLVTPGTFAPLTGVQSRVFNLIAPQLPYLVSPPDGDSLSAKTAATAIIFRWTPVIPSSAAQPFYRLQVFEILPGQRPLQALRGNQPLLDEELRGQSQYIWRPQLPFSTDTLPHRFIWTIQTLDANRRPLMQTSGNGESRSEPFMFIVCNHRQPGTR